MKRFDKFVRNLINKQYEILGVEKDFKYAIENPDWWQEYRLTSEQKVRLWEWGIPAYRKHFKSTMGEAAMKWMELFSVYGFLDQENESNTPL